jgi:multisubunit Na+/H+ antiporter MnhB subunit
MGIIIEAIGIIIIYLLFKIYKVLKEIKNLKDLENPDKDLTNFKPKTWE